MADVSNPAVIESDAEAREFVKRGGHPNDTTPRRQMEIAAHAVNNEIRKEAAKDPTAENPAHRRFQPALGHPSNPFKGPAKPSMDGPRVNYTLPPARALREPQLGSKAAPFVGPPVGSSPGVENPGNLAGFAGPRNIPYVTEEAEAEHRRRQAGQLPAPKQVSAQSRLINSEGQAMPVSPNENQSEIDAARAMLEAPKKEERARQAQLPTGGAGESATPQSAGGNALATDTPRAGAANPADSTGGTGSVAGPTGATGSAGATA